VLVTLSGQNELVATVAGGLLSLGKVENAMCLALLLAVEEKALASLRSPSGNLVGSLSSLLRLYVGLKLLDVNGIGSEP